MAIDVFANRRLLAAALAVEELFRQHFDRVTRVTCSIHRSAPVRSADSRRIDCPP